MAADLQPPAPDRYVKYAIRILHTQFGSEALLIGRSGTRDQGPGIETTGIETRRHYCDVPRAGPSLLVYRGLN